MKAVVFDPRVKMLLFLVGCLFSMNITGFPPLVAFTTYIFLLLLVERQIKIGFLMYGVFLVAATISYWALNIRASIWASLIAAIFSFFRICLPTIMVFVFLFKTTKISEFLSAFERLHVPYAVVIPFAVMFRFFPTIQEEWHGIRQAMAFRGIGLGARGLLLHPVRSIEHILVPLLFSCVTIMDELVAASLARGLDSEKERTCYFSIKMKWYDYLVFLATLGFLALMFVTR